MLPAPIEGTGHTSKRGGVKLSSKAAALLLAPLAAITVVIFLLRLWSLFLSGAILSTTSGGEPIHVYNVVKMGQGIPLYEDPTTPPYTVTLYNGGFYCSYFLWTRLFGFDDERLLLACRLCTVLFTVLFAVAVFRSGRILFRENPARPDRWRHLAILFLLLITSFSTFLGWWSFTTRPDMGGTAFCAFAVLGLLSWERRSDIAAGLISGALFFAAWSFKQSFVLIFLSTLLAGIICRRWKLVLAEASTFAALVACFVRVFGEHYWQNALVGPSLSPFRFANVGGLAGLFFIKGAFPLVLGLGAVWSLSRYRRLSRYQRVFLSVGFAITLIGACFFSLRDGGHLNYYFEAWLMCALLGGVFLTQGTYSAVECPADRCLGPRLPVWCVIAASLAFATGVDAARLLGITSVGTLFIRVPTTHEQETRGVLAGLRTAPGPIYCEPSILGLPWFTQYPAFIYDDYWFYHRMAIERGILKGDGLNHLWRQHTWQTALLFRKSPQLQGALELGYRVALQTPRYVVVEWRPGSSRDDSQGEKSTHRNEGAGVVATRPSP